MKSKLLFSLQRAVEQAWYRPNLSWTALLLPLELIFRWQVKSRLQRRRNTTHPPKVIVVGNISVGGTGKTPVVQALVKWLIDHGLRPGVISRGYGAGTTQFPLAVQPNTDAEACGDEAKMLAQTCGCPVVIDPNRPAALDYLAKHHEVNVVVSDDGLQHYALARDFEIVVIDGQRMFGNGHCLPVGPLREPVSRLAQVDLVLQNGGEAQDYPIFDLEPVAWVNVATNEEITLDKLNSAHQYMVVAGIGNPQRFFSTIERIGLSITPCSFPDHHTFTAGDFQGFHDLPVLMTEKDAVKCCDFARENWWFLKVRAELPNEAQELLTKFIAPLLLTNT